MKLKSIGILTAFSALFTAANANAIPLIDPYIGATIGFGGVTAYANHDDRGYSAQSYGAVIGLDVPIVRMEVAYDFLNSELGKFQVGMINAYLKMPTPMVSPYLGAGVGTIFDGDIAGFDIDKSTAYQAMLGLTFNLPVLPFKIDTEARVLYAHDIVDLGGIEPDILHYDLRAKLRYVF